jgi:uncharacterized protein (DUF433 family)
VLRGEIALDGNSVAQIRDRGLPSAKISSTQFGELVMRIQQVLNRQGIVHTDPEVMSGVPVFVGTRVPLQTFFDYLEGESGLAEFLEDFPHLKTPALQVLEAIAKAMLAQEREASAHSAG